MSVLEGIARGRLCVLLDVRHPLAYLALHPTLQLAQELAAGHGLETDWLPLAVPPLRPPGEPGNDRGTRHRHHRARAIAREIETYAAAQGLELRDPYRDGGSATAARAWLWLREHHRERLEEFLVRLFRAYWADGLDADDGDGLTRVLEAVGADAGWPGGWRTGWREWNAAEGGPAAETLAEGLRERGLFQVPAYVIDDEVFYGRQHLPMLRWIVEGRTGPVPI